MKSVKVLGYVMLHYGADYLEYCLAPLCEVCDKVILLYSLYPTHNTPDKLINPDTREGLKKIADGFANTQWIDVYDIHDEGKHRNEIFKYSGGYDVLVNADSDEVWDVGDLRQAVGQTYNSPYHAHGIDGFINFWKSFNHVTAKYEIKDRKGKVLEGSEECDPYRPVRLWHLGESNTTGQPDIKAKVYHFGYAVKRENMAYKISIHGHRGEWRPEWFDLWDNWHESNRKGRFHPVSEEVWLRIDDFDRTKLPETMRKHPLYG